MQHYHIMYGSVTSDAPSSISNFTNQTYALIDFHKTISQLEKIESPPSFEEIEIDDKTFMLRLITNTNKYILLLCENDCNESAPNFSAYQN